MSIGFVVGSFIGTIISMACLREVAFPSDDTRMSWVKSGVISIPFIFVARSINGAYDGVPDFAGAVLYSGMAFLMTALLFFWARAKSGSSYERKSSASTRTLSWAWLLFISLGILIKIATGLA